MARSSYRLSMARACKIKCQHTNFFTCMMNLVVHVLTLGKSRSRPVRLYEPRAAAVRFCSKGSPITG
ncbi:hypothetical protein NXT3_PC00918 (plasmid) [Sinorhizobium fredii]|uniref:Uncharacterized protein n=1 Tax=Rhizobium fredii TaxID=380 RepID=A0A2L0HF18_RHIFR|nr:hypothetical protein NXT3_PC00918 [Sinorhizobium fredii]